MWRVCVLLLCAVACSSHGQLPTSQEHRITDPKKLAALRQLFVPEMYVRPEDQKKAERLREGYDGPHPCEYEKMELGIRVIAGLPVDQCFKMTDPQAMHGLWRNSFESSQFCAAPINRCPTGNNKEFVWLDFGVPLPGVEDTPPGGLYEVDFVGRKTAYPGVYDGGAPEEVIVDRLISIKLIEPPPHGQISKEHIERYLKDCAGKPICMPNMEVPKVR